MQPHEQWLARAADDLAFAELGFKEKFFSQVCFLSQQVVEKSLKAFLLAQDRTHPRQHKVSELATLCVEITKDLEPFKNDLKLLDQFYIPTRYPDALLEGSNLPNEDEAQSALDAAKAIYEVIRSHIPPGPVSAPAESDNVSGGADSDIE